MKTVVIANPQAAAGSLGRRWASHERRLSRCFGVVEARFTERRGDAMRLAEEAVRGGAERVVAVGGDGTINEVLNGMLAVGVPARAQLAVYPAGTGGDLARSIGLADVDLERAYADATPRRCDVGRVVVRGEEGSSTRHFLNVASVGATGLIVEKVNATTKRFGGKASFVWGTVKGLVSYRNQRMRVRVDDVFEEDILVNCVAVGNGRFFGGGMMIAPGALLDDGLFQIVVIGDVSLATFLRYSGRLYAGTHGSLPEVRMAAGKRVEVTPIDGGAPLVEVDGELAGSAPVTFEVVPAAIEVVVPANKAAGFEASRA